MKEVTAKELEALRINGTGHQLIDVREAYELQEGHIEGLNIPMEEIVSRIDELEKVEPVIIHCRTGKRAAAVIITLESKFGLNNLYCLQGGIMAYAEEVDTSLVIS